MIQKSHLAIKKIEDYRSVAGHEVLDQIYYYAERLHGEHIVMINSTPTGGGVAEILNSLVLLLNNLGLQVGWRILKGSDSFFQITKEFHNAFQGADISLNKRKRGTYEQVNYDNAIMNHLDGHDLVVVHDPQPLPLVRFYKKRIPWIWRFHPDMSKPNKQLMKYIRPFIEQYDAMIVTSPEYIQKELTIKQIVMHPSIDPLSDKNSYLEKEKVEKLLHRRGVNLKKPIISQISRFDVWKDPIGVIDVFKRVRKKKNCQLVLMGNMASDDPEGPEIYREVMKYANGDPDVTVIVNSPDNDRTVNALQRASHVVLQKSLREGFALTVSEAMWKEAAVVGTKVGGIPIQIQHRKSGMLVGSNEGAAQAVLELLHDSKLRKRLGKNAKERVRDNFLITRHVLDYLKLFDYYLTIQHKFNIGRDYPHRFN